MSRVTSENIVKVSK